MKLHRWLRLCRGPWRPETAPVLGRFRGAEPSSSIHRDLAGTLIIFLIRKELKVRYKNSVLGFLWSFLNPASILCVYYVVFKFFLNNHIVYFAIYLFAGLLPWNLFNNSLLSSAGVLVAQAGIVKKVSFPRDPRPRPGRHRHLLLLLPGLHHAGLPRRIRGAAGLEVPPVMVFASSATSCCRQPGGLPLGCDRLPAGRAALDRGCARGRFFSAPIVYPFATVGHKLAQHGTCGSTSVTPSSRSCSPSSGSSTERGAR